MGKPFALGRLLYTGSAKFQKQSMDEGVYIFLTWWPLIEEHQDFQVSTFGFAIHQNSKYEQPSQLDLLIVEEEGRC